MKFVMVGINGYPVCKEQLLEVIDLKLTHESIPKYTDNDLTYDGKRAKVINITILAVEET